MLNSNLNKLSALALLIMIFLGVSSSAPSIQATGEERVWLNDEAEGKVFDVSCDSENQKKFYIDSGNAPELSGNEISTQELQNSITNPGLYNLTVMCYNTPQPGQGSENASNTSVLFSAVELDLNILDDGRGFVGGKLGDGIVWGDTSPSTSSDPVEVSLDIKQGQDQQDRDLEEVFGEEYVDNLQFNEGLSIPQNGISTQDSDTFVLNPKVNQYIDSTDLVVQAEDGDRILERDVNPEVSEWTAELVGGENPGRRMDFRQALKGDYSYLLNVDKVSGKQNILNPNDFVLTVLVKSKENSEYVSTDELDGTDELENEKWLKWSEPSGQVGTHRVILDNVKELEKLPDRQYKFLLKFERDGYSSFVIDQVLVDKQSEFSGRIVDTQSSGVETVMKLRNPERNVRISTGKNGYYSKEINSDAFDSVVLDFYKRGKLSPDTTVAVSNPELSSNSDLGRGGSAVKFDYWSDPEVSIKGVDPVNMMAVKFGYPIDSFDEAEIKFDPSNVNPENLKVYECSFWNFEGSRCLGSWKKVDSDGFSVNMGISPPDVHISNLVPYNAPSGKDILMNAYVIGTSSDISIRDTLKIGGQTDGRAKKGGELKFTGFIENQKGNLVSEGIPVEIELQSSSESKNYTGQTDSNGKFTIEGDAPEIEGEYAVTLFSNPETYDGFSVDYSQPLTVFTKKQIDIEAPESFTLEKGDEKAMQIEIKNTGQAPVEVQEIIADGVSSDFFSWVEKASGRLDPGESGKAELKIDLPEAYADSYSSLGIKAEASHDGKTIESSTTAQIRARDVVIDSPENENNNSDSGLAKDNQTPSNSSSSPSPGLASATGNFIESTSNLNLALGLIMILMMVVAGAVKKGSDPSVNRGSSRQNKRGRPSMGRDSVSAREEHDDQSSKPETDNPEDADQNTEKDVFVDEETGKEFDTKEALELYQQTK
mgnify:FL=1